MSAVQLSLRDTMGAAYVGVIASGILHGVSLIQAWYYFTHQRDPWHTIILVSAVLLFDTVHQGLISYTVYYYVIANYGNAVTIGELVWSLLVEVYFNAFTGLLVQSFLAMRIWRLSNRNVWLTSAVCTFILAEFGCCLAFASLSLHLKTFVELAELSPLSISVNALAAAGDVLIAVILCTLLHRSRTGFHRSDTIINKLIIFAVNTGVLTSLCAVGSLISITVAGNTFWYIAFFFCMGRLYSNSLLATLNARKMIRGSADGAFSSEDNNVSIFAKGMMSMGSRHRPTTTNISIKIDTTKEIDTDVETNLTFAQPEDLTPISYKGTGSPTFGERGTKEEGSEGSSSQSIV
ncbi:hypothetical protein BD626DRAFT_180211 [Schizophyllum amplum]|uniref:DUF6534 domain-containing protein n=1 Tax=Schizophyllum amplum TaxID=97359 RepID=A0A550C280_9AGAR|nr:hypothetical protein BD626DRAFT_180211 [Auriculariopsis ampla]